MSDNSELFQELAEHFSILQFKTITTTEIIHALYFRLESSREIEWIGWMNDEKLDFEECISLLEDFDFSCFENPIECVEGSIPQHMMTQTKARVKMSGNIWVIHKYDKDPFPSNPHAHLLNSRVKLHLGTGECFIGKNVEYQIKLKDLIKIRDKIDTIRLPKLE
jgi:hypothetical protein